MLILKLSITLFDAHAACEPPHLWKVDVEACTFVACTVSHGEVSEMINTSLKVPIEDGDSFL